ncbi:MAG: SpoIIE family protein phosphatase, partial [Cyclonatronaceae bacterium]
MMMCLGVGFSGTFGPAAAVQETAVQQLSGSDLLQEQGIVYLTDQWKYKPADDPAFAARQFDDSGWESISDLAFAEWEGLGWFRLRFSVDSTLVNRPVALLIERHTGASEVYLNGELQFRLGEVGDASGGYKAFTDYRPRVLVFPEAGEQVLAVRFANRSTSYFIEEQQMAGFRFLLGDAAYHLASTADTALWRAGWQSFFLGLLLVFALIHALLFSFYPSEKRNLYFSLFTLFLGLLVLSIFRTEITHSPQESILFSKIGQTTWILTILYALRFTYSLYQKNTPRPFWGFAAAGALLTMGIWLNSEAVYVLRELYVLLAVLEMLRALASVIFARRAGAWIIGFGIFCFLVSVLYRIIINLNLLSGETVTASILGSGTMILAMSVFLSRDFALTQRQLEQKLLEVKQLSQKSLEQEQRNKEIEIESRLLEAENKRKSKELEEARQLQLSMLPDTMPNASGIDISVFMETATEVGGDYYDYSAQENGLVLALGDATGHGMKAGIMVAAAKSYFHTLAAEPDQPQMMHAISAGIRNMKLHMMYMGLSILRFQGQEAELIAAGMPPVLWYRKRRQCVERITFKSLPLGTPARFPYENRRIHLQPGDVLFMMSDGLMELFNERREQLGLQRIEAQLRRSAGEDSDAIIQHMRQMMHDWSGSHKNED